MKKKLSIKEFIGVSLFSAIIIMMTYIPNIAFITIPFLPIQITLLFIPVLLGSAIYGLKGGVILGFVFGLSSFIISWIRPTTPFDIFFHNPLVSIFPRLLLPILFIYFTKAFNKINPHIISLIIGIIAIMAFVFYYYNQNNLALLSAIFLVVLAIAVLIFNIFTSKKNFEYILPVFLSVLIHGVIVMSMIMLFNGESLSEMFGGKSLMFILVSVIITNTLFEAVLTSVIIQLMMPVIKKVRYE